MTRFLLRRFAMALGTLVVLSIFIHFAVDLAIDPLDDLRQSTSPQKEALIEGRQAQLMLDQPWIVRYWDWASGFVQGHFGVAWRTGELVTDLLRGAVATSVTLIFGATLMALLLGVTVGLISALRQYTGFDYTITFVSFVLYSLPVFWVAVLLKQFLAIGINDFLNTPAMNIPLTVGISAVAGLFWAGAIGGDRKRKLLIFVTAMAVTAGSWIFILYSGWLNAPSVGIIGLTVIGLAAAYVVTLLFAGIRNRRALGAAATTAVVGVLLYMPLQWVFYYVGDAMNVPVLLGLLVVAVGVALLIGWLFGGPDRGVSMRGAAIVAVIISVLIYIDRIMQSYPAYFTSSAVRGRPIATIGAQTPNLHGDFWTTQLDSFMHILLPTIALVLISFASYTRYQRGAMLEVMSQDYIRTARSKGLTERVVITRHALRNALMPLASIIPVDLVSLIGGAVLTETIFGWNGMGKLFIDSLGRAEIDPVMAYVMITGALAMAANLVADFLYAVLDPRIRVNA